MAEQEPSLEQLVGSLETSQREVVAAIERGEPVSMTRLVAHVETLEAAQSRGAELAGFWRAVQPMAERLKSSEWKQAVARLRESRAVIERKFDGVKRVELGVQYDFEDAIDALLALGIEPDSDVALLTRVRAVQRKIDGLDITYGDLRVNRYEHPDYSIELAQSLDAYLDGARELGIDVSEYESEVSWALTRHDLDERIRDAQEVIEGSRSKLTDDAIMRYRQLINDGVSFSLFTSDLEHVLEDHIEEHDPQAVERRQARRRQQEQAREVGQGGRERASQLPVVPVKPTRVVTGGNIEQTVRAHLGQVRRSIPRGANGATSARLLVEAVVAMRRAGERDFAGTYSDFFSMIHKRGYTERRVSTRAGGDGLKLLYPLTPIFSKEDVTRRLLVRTEGLNDPMSKLFAEVHARTELDSD